MGRTILAGEIHGPFLSQRGDTLRQIMAERHRDRHIPTMVLPFLFTWPATGCTSSIGRTKTLTCEKTNMRGSSAQRVPGCIFSTERPARY